MMPAPPRPGYLFLLLLLAAALASCRVHRVVAEPAPLTPPAEAFSRPADGRDPAARWWLSFDDRTLTALVDQALRENLDLRAAWARLRQAAARAKQAGAARLPAFTLQAGASRAKRSLAAGGLPINIDTTTTTWSLSLAASYEVDLWGRVASLADAAGLEEAATRLDLETLAVTLSTQVGESWFALLQERALIDLLRRQVETNRTLLELVELRFATGRATAVDVYQQRRQLAATEAEIPPARARLAALRTSLAILLGRDPVGWEPPAGRRLPEVPPLPGPGLPADLLGHRPDIAAARLRVAAADHRLGAAVAGRLPSLSLTGGAGYQQTELEDLFDDWIWNLAAGLTAPLFQGGRLEAAEEEARAALREVTCRFSQAFLQGVKEVEDALAAEKQQSAYLKVLRRQERVSRSALEESRTRFRNGLSDYLPVLTELQALQRLERTLIVARRQLLSYRVQLHRALGGTWTQGLDRQETPGMGEER